MTRNKQILIRVTKVEKFIIKTNAKHSGMDVASFVRKRAIAKKDDVIVSMLRPLLTKKQIEGLRKKLEETWE